MFGSEGVSQSIYDLDISRLSKKITALEIRAKLIEETINSNPQLKEAYQKAWAATSQKRMRNDLEWMGCGV